MEQTEELRLKAIEARAKLTARMRPEDICELMPDVMDWILCRPVSTHQTPMNFVSELQIMHDLELAQEILAANFQNPKEVGERMAKRIKAMLKEQEQES